MKSGEHARSPEPTRRGPAGLVPAGHGLPRRPAPRGVYSPGRPPGGPVRPCARLRLSIFLAPSPRRAPPLPRRGPVARPAREKAGAGRIGVFCGGEGRRRALGGPTCPGADAHWPGGPTRRGPADRVPAESRLPVDRRRRSLRSRPAAGKAGAALRPAAALPPSGPPRPLYATAAPTRARGPERTGMRWGGSECRLLE